MTSSTDINLESSPHKVSGTLGALMLGALGVVYGDIGTSPLYTLKTVLEWAGSSAPDVAYGSLSLIVWTLLITTSIKYVGLVSNINGARTPESLITYDGAPAVRTRSNGSGIGAADVDSTSEIQILTAAYSVEFGRSSGGQIRILTRSGGAQFHGGVYDYVRNDVFNANTWARNHTALQNFVAPVNYN